MFNGRSFDHPATGPLWYFDDAALVVGTDQYEHAGGDAAAGALNTSGYMWWDLFNLNFGASERVELCPEIIAALRRILAIPHDACRESALHGIGHLIVDYPGESEALTQLIDDFLRSTPGVRTELAAYAASARRG